MSDKRKGKQRNLDLEEEKPTKEEYAVAKYLRFGLPVREGKLHGMEVKCFIASAAVDKLLESKWSASKNKTDPLFTNRASCVFYMDILLQKGLFHRADRDRKKKDKEKETGKRKKKEKEKEKEEPAVEEGVKQRKNRKDKKSKKEDEGNTDKNGDEADGKEVAEKKTDKKEDKKKKERRLKLLMSEKQWFEDGDEVFVWIYDPVNAKTFIIGLLMVFGAIGLCMFPLWPEEVRIGVYYVSLAGAGFVGFILFLVIVRLILFCLVWLLTIGHHHFWFLPNLTEDVGFFESFRPLYKHDVVSGKAEAESGKKKKKKKSGSDESEVQDKKKEKSSDKDDSDEFEVIKKEELEDNKANAEEGEENDRGEQDDNEEEDERDENEYDDEEDEMPDDNNDVDDDMENDQYGDDDDNDMNGENSEEDEHNEPKKSK